MLIGMATLERGDVLRARESLTNAIRELKDLGHEEFLASSLYGLALALDRSSLPEQASKLKLMTDAACASVRYVDGFDEAQREALDRIGSRKDHVPVDSTLTLCDVADHALQALRGEVSGWLVDSREPSPRFCEAIH